MMNAPMNDQAKQANLYAQFRPLVQDLYFLDAVFEELVIISSTSVVVQAAAGFFWMTSFVLWDYVMLGLCRLSDPPTHAGRQDRQNMTLPGLIGRINDETLKNELMALFNSSGPDREAIRTQRNKRIAHNDTQTMHRNAASTVPQTLELQPVRRTLAVYLEIVERIELHCTGGTENATGAAATYRRIPNGAERLVALLDASNQ